MPSCMFIAAFWSPAGKGANILTLLYVMVSCVFVTFPCGVLGQVWYLIVTFPEATGGGHLNACIRPDVHHLRHRKPFSVNKLTQQSSHGNKNTVSKTA